MIYLTTVLITAFLSFAVISATAMTVDELHQTAIDALHSKNHDEALKTLQEAMKIKPNDPLLLNTAGVVLNSIGEIDRAAEYFATSLKLDPLSFNANYNAANLMHYAVFDNNIDMIDALDSSIGYYQKALESMASSNETNNQISKEEKVSFLNDASVAMKKKSRNSEVIELLNKLIEIDAKNVQALGNLALAYLDTGDLESAQRTSLVAIENNPQNVDIHRNYSVILQKMGFEELAQKHLDKAVKLGNPPVNDDEIIFGMSFEHLSVDTQKTLNINIELKKSDNPIAIVNELQAEIGLDLLTYRWLHCILHHAIARLDEEIILEKVINVDGKELSIIRVHYGDDLFALARSYTYQHGLSSEATGSIYQSLVDQVPQHSELSWVQKRKNQILNNNPANIRDNDDYLSAMRHNHQASERCKITLAIVTSGKLDHFYNLIMKFPATDLVCEVMVFDYLSSHTDKMAMVKEFPQFNFVFIAEKEKGHAQSLNNMLRLAKTSYLLYVDDSWEPIDNSGESIEKAYLLMEAASTLGMPIAQVLMNEQSAKSCALGLNLIECQNNESYGRAGWPRSVTVDNTSFKFLEHEFGVQYLDHQFSSSWPGFSSHHPGLWNLNLLTSNVKNTYKEDHNDYAMLFSLQLWENGMSTAHLPDFSFRYIGQ